MSPTRPEMPPSVPPANPGAAKIAATRAPTMPLRIKLAPMADSQPKTTLIHLVVPNSAFLL